MTINKTRVALAFITLLAACASERSNPTPETVPAKPAHPSVETPPRLTYLANQGVMLRAGNDVVVIDGLHRFYGKAYAVLPDPERQRIETAADRYADVDVIAATHRHGDHFSAEAVLSHMRANPDARFVAAPQAVADIAALDGVSAIRSRIVEIPWLVGDTRKLESSAIPIELLGLRHAGKRHVGVHNLGVLVTLGGLRFLHIGDATPNRENFEPFDLRKRAITAVIVPPWFINSESGRAVIRDSIGATHVFVAHIDPRWSADQVAQLIADMPGAIALTNPLDSWSVTHALATPVGQ